MLDPDLDPAPAPCLSLVLGAGLGLGDGDPRVLQPLLAPPPEKSQKVWSAASQRLELSLADGLLLCLLLWVCPSPPPHL